MLGETVHAYILTPALAIAVPRLHSSAACRGDWGGRLSNPQLSQWDVKISRLTALVARKTDTVFGECLKHYLTADTHSTLS